MEVTNRMANERIETPDNPGLDIDALAKQVAVNVKLPSDLSGMIDEAVEKAIVDRGLGDVVRKTVWDAGAGDDETTRSFLAKQFVTAAIFRGCGMPLTGLQHTNSNGAF